MYYKNYYHWWTISVAFNSIVLGKNWYFFVRLVFGTLSFCATVAIFCNKQTRDETSGSGFFSKLSSNRIQFWRFRYRYRCIVKTVLLYVTYILHYIYVCICSRLLSDIQMCDKYVKIWNFVIVCPYIHALCENAWIDV